MKILKNKQVQTLPETVDDINMIVIEDGFAVRRTLQRVRLFPSEVKFGLPQIYLFTKEKPCEFELYPIPDRNLNATVCGIREVVL